MAGVAVGAAQSGRSKPAPTKKMRVRRVGELMDEISRLRIQAGSPAWRGR